MTKEEWLALVESGRLIGAEVESLSLRNAMKGHVDSCTVTETHLRVSVRDLRAGPSRRDTSLIGSHDFDFSWSALLSAEEGRFSITFNDWSSGFYSLAHVRITLPL